MNAYTLYSDGACRGNPGPGSWGCIAQMPDGYTLFESSGFDALTTNNRMEMMAAIAGLRELKTRCTIIVHSDSKLLVDTMSNGWVEKWKEGDWENRLNADLWDELSTLCEEHVVVFRWIKGHNGHPQNEYCDQLAKKAARRRKGLLVDTNYESKTDSRSLFS